MVTKGSELFEFPSQMEVASFLELEISKVVVALGIVAEVSIVVQAQNRSFTQEFNKTANARAVTILRMVIISEKKTSAWAEVFNNN